ncbi:chondroitin sulfate N-acetylgalactosaminyltransferase 1-like [Saccostrea echinata]|uniref:chondroitin sulfate N-acetylgalactosaminyltransferase 1-like n=1 Tax=Saccostrea echinata TaxID=191078 RepID=UPI002A7EE8F3|nr:chondroitin sulfate N-acetylgalactosaminyltransferase 1-like [Saccostrea echinata]XP_061196133.1 chondroitin sulfate N-acetylgalactosaminyltransferase 1-like [Saccostrea echinata]XP_061196134.1 chondroitin sulfate N-acetylgalactosaminyltransferase 1-like [Saccostrea echinata]
MGKPMPRVLVLLFLLSVLTMVVITRWGLVMDNISTTVPQQTRHTRELFQAAIEESEKRHQTRIEELQSRIKDLEGILNSQRLQRENVTASMNESESKSSIVHKYLSDKLQAAEILHGVELKNEFEMTAFNRFTLHRIYLVDPGLGKRVVEKPIGSKRRDLYEVISYSVGTLNEQRKNMSKIFTISDFIEGIYRTDPASGTHYELYFRNINSKESGRYSKVAILKPFGPLMTAINTTVRTRETWINIILPLKGRLDSFEIFMKNFVDVCIAIDKHIYLTIVYFGKEGLDTVKNITKNVSHTYGYKFMRVINVNEEFSRGRGLQIGMETWRSKDVVIFMCDVDIIFNAEFLERCRLNTEKQKKVYYPIVFSLFNPKLVYSLENRTIPSIKRQLVISKTTGFWRDFGYGMTCQYLSDFRAVKGFSEGIIGWGGEDVFLYKKYVRSNMIVVRATDPGIFHLWHDKVCPVTLSADQYRGCIRSKSFSEASHAQLGILAFKDQIDIQKLHRKK